MAYSVVLKQVTVPILFGPGFAVQLTGLHGLQYFFQGLVTLAIWRDVFAGYAQHKPGLQSQRGLNLLWISQFFADGEYETTALLHRPCL